MSTPFLFCWEAAPPPGAEVASACLRLLHADAQFRRGSLTHRAVASLLKKKGFQKGAWNHQKVDAQNNMLKG